MAQRLCLLLASIILLCGNTGCHLRSPSAKDHLQALSQTRLLLPQQTVIRAFLAQTRAERVQGLSAVPSSSFGPEDGMLFIYSRSEHRVFHMRKMFFDLDIIFLNQDLQIVAIERDLPHPASHAKKAPVARTRPVMCRYVLEMRSDSAIAKRLQPGMILTWLPKEGLNPYVLF